MPHATRRSIRRLSVALIAAAIAAVGATSPALAQPAQTPPAVAQPKKLTPPVVVTSIAPLRGLVEPMLVDAGLAKIGDVKTLIPPGVSEHGYEFPPSTLAQLAKADIVVLVGLGLEPQVEKYLADRPREGRKVLIAGDILGLKGDAHHHHDHDHADHDHDHEHCDHAVDPHVWLDPMSAEKIVSAVAAALAERAMATADTDAATRIRAAEAGLLMKIRDVDAEYRKALANPATRTLVVGHDAWGHLAQRYNLKTVAIKGMTATEPTPAAQAAAIKTIRDEGVKAVFVEPQLSQQAGRRIASITKVPVLVIDPLGDGDWLKMMRSNLEQIVKGLGEAPKPDAPASSPASTK